MNGIMIQGTSSGSGKTFIVTGLCRLLTNMGFQVCPFKSQNMSNNAYVTHDGLEISTAQAVQAGAANLRPEVFMNPILLKPRHDKSSEIILNGKVFSPSTKNYRNFTQNEGINAVRKALNYISQNFQAVIIEGAGSPAEINLNSFEIVNMRISREADVPVILIADVDRGGSLAAVTGTLELLGNDRKRVKGIIFNMFRGDIELFKDAVKWTEDYTGVKVLGVVPFMNGVNIADEDSLNITEHHSSLSKKILIGIMKFPGISNFSDFDALKIENDTEFIYIDENITLKKFNSLDAVILPGTKNTFSALKWLRDYGFDALLRSFRGCIFGICGGFQILGSEIADDYYHENHDFTRLDGLNLLPLKTNFNSENKITRQVSGFIYGTDKKISGYEIHFGRSECYYNHEFLPMFLINDEPEGICGHEMRISGTYLHGAFNNDNFRNLWLNNIRKNKNYGEHETHTVINNSYDEISGILSKSLDVDFIVDLIFHRAGTTPQPV